MPCLKCCWKNTEDVKEEVFDGDSIAVAVKFIKGPPKLWSRCVKTVLCINCFTQFSSSRGECNCENPRNKCALQPGHSLMDWIRLGSSGKDLSGVGSHAGHLTVTLSQLAEHDKKTDAWLAIRGKVYNVTYYLPFHPGGPEELMKGAGKDATNLFDQIHPWVNYDQILNKCLIGRLVFVDTNNLFTVKPKSPSIPNNTSSLKTSAQQQKYSNVGGVKPDNLQETLMLPRFDWIQKLNTVTIIFYTKGYANPQVEINPPNQENEVNIFLTYETQLFLNELKFSDGIQWPCQIKINYETGKIEVVFKKAVSRIWENVGVLKQKSGDLALMHSKLKYCVVNKVNVNHNSCLLELERVDNTKLTVPLGRHVTVFGKMKGQEMSRSYTPVPCSLFTKYQPQVFTTDNVCLMIKHYPNGNISKYICSKNKYDVLEITQTFDTFGLQQFENKKIFLLLAAGTGITPMLGLLLFILERRVTKCHRVSLVFFNKHEDDILFKDQLEMLGKSDGRLQVEHVLSQASTKWKGAKGYVTMELLQATLSKQSENTAYTNKDVFVLICGPTIFSNLACSLLNALGVSDQQMHKFLG